jgi:hypothetical protein
MVTGALVVPSLTGLGSFFCCLPRTYVRGYHMPPLQGWSGAAHFARFARTSVCDVPSGAEARVDL